MVWFGGNFGGRGPASAFHDSAWVWIHQRRRIRTKTTSSGLYEVTDNPLYIDRRTDFLLEFGQDIPLGRRSVWRTHFVWLRCFLALTERIHRHMGRAHALSSQLSWICSFTVRWISQCRTGDTF